MSFIVDPPQSLLDSNFAQECRRFVTSSDAAAASTNVEIEVEVDDMTVTMSAEEDVEKATKMLEIEESTLEPESSKTVDNMKIVTISSEQPSNRLKKHSVKELRKLCTEKGLESTGLRQHLIERLTTNQ